MVKRKETPSPFSSLQLPSAVRVFKQGDSSCFIYLPKDPWLDRSLSHCTGMMERVGPRDNGGPQG